MIIIEELTWDEWNINHITKHSVTIVEIEQACKNQKKAYVSYSNRVIIIGETNTARLLSIVLAESLEVKNSYYVVTARDISSKERKLI
jgi:uncharacterized DUF497 family protein